MKNTSLAVYLPNLAGGGVERMKLILADAFIKKGYDVTFVLNRAEGELLALLPPSVKVVSLDARRTLAALPRLVAFLRREQPD
ncbi:MAG: glycosyltransferase, partial [Burkholderiaceae bacterium]